MQAPGGPEEDTSGDFRYGGWTAPYFDKNLGQVIGEELGKPFDLLLGRKTFELFAAYWPDHPDEIPGFTNATKFVASHTLTGHPWKTTIILDGNLVEELKKLKQQDGPDLQVHGSADLIQTLLKNDLVDELWLKIFPVTLGQGKRLFDGGAIPGSFTLVDAKSTPKGVIIANFKHTGDVQTGSF